MLRVDRRRSRPPDLGVQSCDSCDSCGDTTILKKLKSDSGYPTTGVSEWNSRKRIQDKITYSPQPTKRVNYNQPLLRHPPPLQFKRKNLETSHTAHRLITTKKSTHTLPSQEPAHFEYEWNSKYNTNEYDPVKLMFL